MAIRLLSGGKEAVVWRRPPTPHITEVKERVKLYLSFSYGTS
jgi:hypothetical protein